MKISKKTTNQNLKSSLLQLAMQNELKKFEECYIWLEESMPSVFFDEVAKEKISLVAHGLIGFDQQEYFCTINIKGSAIVMCLDSPDADLRILRTICELWYSKLSMLYLLKTPSNKF